MEITAIIAQKRKPGRVNIYLDGSFFLGIDEKLLVDYDLYKGKNVTDEDLTKLADAEDQTKSLARAYRFLSFRPHSRFELEKKLLDKHDEKIVNQTLKKLEEYHYLDDLEFAKIWVSERGSSRGKRALTFELAKKGVSKEICEEVLSDINEEKEEETALRLIQKKPKYRNIKKNEAYSKIGGFLSRRGFSYDTIKKIIKRIYEDR